MEKNGLPIPTPTSEQQGAATELATGKNLVIQAGAGTGKTSTLEFLAASDTARSGLYIAFNRTIKDAAA